MGAGGAGRRGSGDAVRPGREGVGERGGREREGRRDSPGPSRTGLSIPTSTSRRTNFQPLPDSRNDDLVVKAGDRTFYNAAKE